MGREILTLQLGNYSNYIGTHWWNIQESSFNYDPTAEPSEIDHSILYREGQTSQRQATFTPRLLMVDLGGTLGHIPRTGDLYSDPFDPTQITADADLSALPAVEWDAQKLEVVKQGEPAKRHPYQADLASGSSVGDKDYDFANTVENWIDFSYTRYHPRSINVIERYTHSKDENPFDTITNGMELWREVDFQDDLTDRTRQYVEECDACQGFQMLFDCTDGFSGLGLKLLEHLQDEFGKPSLLFPVFSPKPPLFKSAGEAMSDSIRVINTALTFAQLPDCASLFVPLSTMERCWRSVGEPRLLPNLAYISSNLYQTSGILASFLETASLRFRLKEPANAGFLAGLCCDLNTYGRKMAAAGLALPFPLGSTQDLIDCLDQLDDKDKSLSVQLSPNVNVGNRAVVQSVCARGLPLNRLKRPPTAKSAQRQQIMPAYRCTSVSEMLQFFFSCSLEVSMSHVTSVAAPMTIRQPFPVELFDKRVGVDGFLTDCPLTQASMAYVQQCPALATIQSSTDLGDGLEALHREVSRIKLAKIPRFAECGLEEMDYKETVERLLDLKENYDENYEL